MYWFRDGIFYFIPWLVAMLPTWAGGWMIISRAFRLKSHERLLAGFGFGLIIYLFLANIFGYFLPSQIVFSLPALVVFLFGLALSYRHKKLDLEWKDLFQWKVLLFGLLMTLLITRVEQGLAISDDPKNMTVISQLATGEIPARHYLDGTKVFSSHYGFHLLGASMMSIGNAMPWSAFDISKAITSAYGLIVSYLIIRRYVTDPKKVAITVALMTIVGGTRWLFFLMPQSILKPLDDLITMQGTSALMNMPFSQAIYEKWTLDGGPPLGYIFGFLNSLNGFFFHGHSGGLVTLGLIWLTLNYTRKFSSYLLYVPLFAMSAMSTETSFVFFAFGTVAATIWAFIRRKPDKSIELGLCAALLISLPIITFQGGYITSKASSIFAGKPVISTEVSEPTDDVDPDSPADITSMSFLNFSLRLPPGIPNAHLGELSLTEPLLVLTAILEIGPFILIVPWILAFIWKKYRQNDVYLGILVFSTTAAFLFPVFFKYYVDRDITKIMSHAISNWKTILLLFIWVKVESTGWKKWVDTAVRYFAIGSVALAAMGGIVITIANLSAISKPVLSHNINSLDAYVSRDTWNKLDESAFIFDDRRWRASALTGLPTKYGAVSSGTAEWNQINKAATVENLTKAGYRYVYIDKDWWYNLPNSSRKDLSRSCVVTVTEYIDDWPLDIPDFRRLIDISACEE